MKKFFIGIWQWFLSLSLVGKAVVIGVLVVMVLFGRYLKEKEGVCNKMCRRSL